MLGCSFDGSNDNVEQTAVGSGPVASGKIQSMSLSYRRSKKIGPFRVNSSKSGISVSMKLGPLRVTRTAKGKFTTTTSTGIPGLSHRKQW